MGGTRYTPTDWDHFTTTRTAGKSTAHVFTSSRLKTNLDPKGVTVRESRDSAVNPQATAVIVGLDVTGSMGMIADNISRNGLRVLFEEIYSRKPVTDPHVMFMGIGDVTCDSAPLQVSQFEGGIEVADQLTDLYLEHGGGNNYGESYTLPWYFAAMRTGIDCLEKRGHKGYLFTVGDEEPPELLRASELQRVLGDGQYSDLTASQLLDMVSRSYHVFHVIVEQGSACHSSSRRDSVVRQWTTLLGQRALLLKDYTKLAEVIVSAIEVTEGRDAAAVVKSWSGDTSLVVAEAVGALVKAPTAAGAVVSF